MRIISSSEPVVCGAQNLLAERFALGGSADEVVGWRGGMEELRTCDDNDDAVIPFPSIKEHVSTADISKEQPTTITPPPLIPHGPSNQPTTRNLIKSLPTSLRTRASSLTDPVPLPHRWTFPSVPRYRIADTHAFAALGLHNIEWYMTTGVLSEDPYGIKWAAGTHRYLLFWDSDLVPLLPGSALGAHGEEEEGRKGYVSNAGPGEIRAWQRGRWEEREIHSLSVVWSDRPATPIVDDDDDEEAPFSLLWSRVGSLPPTPSAKRVLPETSRSALSVGRRRRSEADGGEGLGEETPRRERRARFSREKRCRWLVGEVDEHGAPVESVEGEGKVDEMVLLEDNEGRTERNWNEGIEGESWCGGE